MALVVNKFIGTGLDAVKIGNGSVSNTEFQRLNGITGDIQTQLDAKINSTEKGAVNGVASLDGSGKVPVAQLPSAIMEYQGVYNASTNTPTLADFVDGPTAGDAIGNVYRVTVAGSQNFGSGVISFEVGDYVILNSSGKWEKSDTTDAVASVNGATGVVVLNTDDIAEGVALYFNDERAQDAVGGILTDTASVDFTYNDVGNQITAAVLPAGVDHDALLNFVANEHVDHSAVQVATSVTSGLAGGGDITATRNLVVDPNSATAATVAGGDLLLIADVDAANALKKVTAQSIADLAGAGVVPTKQTFVLAAGDITNQYIDLSAVALTGSIILKIRGAGEVLEGASYEYSVSYTGGVGGNTRITFLNDIATVGSAALIAGDVLQVNYIV